MKKSLVILLGLIMIVGILAGCGSEKPAADDHYKIALITMNRVDWHWITLEEGAMKAAVELGVEVINMSPDTTDDAQQIGQIESAVSSGCDAIVIAANSTDPVSSALQEAADAGVKIVCVDASANVAAEAAFTTDQKAAGFAAGETMIAELEARGITDGTVGIVSVNADADAASQREAGFREAFEGKRYTLLETRYGEGEAAAFQTVAESFINQGAVGIFGCNEGAAVGSGDAVKAANLNTVVVGFGRSDAIMGLMDGGYIRATVVQNPDTMGYEGVKAAVAALKGEMLGGAVTDTGFSVLKTEIPPVAAPSPGSNDYKIALITVDRIDRHWLALEEGAMKAAAELGCEVINMSPNRKNDAQQIQQISDAVSSGCDAIVVAANGSDGISTALQEAADAGVKIICVDAPVNIKAEATFSTNNKTAGFTAGQTMIAQLEAQGITEGAIGIISVNAVTDDAVLREVGFREAFDGKTYTLLETQYSEGDAAKSQTLAEELIGQDVVGIFGCCEGATIGSGNAVMASDVQTVVVGFGDSGAIRRLIDDGYVLAAVMHNPDVMGYEAVKAACVVLGGRNLGGSVMDTGVTVLTK